MWSLKRSFLVAFLAGIVVVVGLAAFNRLAVSGDARMADEWAPSVRGRPLVDGIWLRDQMQPSEMARLPVEGVRTVIDLRPDDEEAGQPSADAMAQAASQAGLAFHYIPVPHGEVPDAAVEALAQSLTQVRPSGESVLLYCRSGRRAARTWALAEASRVDGLDAQAIDNAVRAAGQSVEDLHDAIAQRIARRPKAP